MRLFVCEKCGNTVPRNARACGYCGQLFRGVKCPECGFEGEPELFGEGCPSCGFTGEVHGTGGETESKPVIKKNPIYIPKKQGKRMLPLSFYRIAGIVSILLLIALILIVIRFYM